MDVESCLKSQASKKLLQNTGICYHYFIVSSHFFHSKGIKSVRFSRRDVALGYTISDCFSHPIGLNPFPSKSHRFQCTRLP